MKVPAIGDILFPGTLDVEVKRIENEVVYCERDEYEYEMPAAIFESVDLSINRSK